MFNRWDCLSVSEARLLRYRGGNFNLHKQMAESKSRYIADDWSEEDENAFWGSSSGFHPIEDPETPSEVNVMNEGSKLSIRSLVCKHISIKLYLGNDIVFKHIDAGFKFTRI